MLLPSLGGGNVLELMKSWAIVCVLTANLKYVPQVGLARFT